MTLHLFIALVLLNIIDAVTTLAILHSGGREMNPYVDRIMRAIGVIPALLLTKVVPLAGLAYFISDVPVWLLGVLVVFYVGVVIHNVRVLRAMP